MILSANNTLFEDIEHAKKKGFVEDFIYTDGTLSGRNNKKKYSGYECTLAEYLRHEGLNDPSDASILFLIACADGTKGCLSSAYGKDADPNLINFVLALKK